MALIELEQAKDTPISVYPRGPMQVRYAYARSMDSIKAGVRGQDYLVFRAEPHRIVFAVCDGVGNSFYGGVGSQIVGEKLAEMLWHIPVYSEYSATAQEIHQSLHEETGFAKQFISQMDFSHMPEIKRNALLNQAKEVGTQSNFVSGLVETPSPELPEGRVVLFWLGDAKLRVWKGNEDKSELLEAIWNSKEGWSSKAGVIGDIRHFACTLQDIDCVMAHSDGLDSISDQFNPDMAGNVINAGIKCIQNGRNSDDISFLEITYSNEIIDTSDDLIDKLRFRKNIETHSPETPPEGNESSPEVQESALETEKNLNQFLPSRKLLLATLSFACFLVCMLISFYLGALFS
jgi:hypothetical protein